MFSGRQLKTTISRDCVKHSGRKHGVSSKVFVIAYSMSICYTIFFFLPELWKLKENIFIFHKAEHGKCEVIKKILFVIFVFFCKDSETFDYLVLASLNGKTFIVRD